MDLSNKQVLITAGPTWVAMDAIRVISNTATGQTGLLLADKLREAGARVTLLLGPAEVSCSFRGIRVIRFRFFDELLQLLSKELKRGYYHSVVHAAAVSDYQPDAVYPGKFSSRKKIWNVRLVPTRKIIERVKEIAPDVVLVGFKFLHGAHKDLLLREAKKLLIESKADMAVANTVKNGAYRAYLVNWNWVEGPFLNKIMLVKSLAKILSGL